MARSTSAVAAISLGVLSKVCPRKAIAMEVCIAGVVTGAVTAIVGIILAGSATTSSCDEGYIAPVTLRITVR